MRWVQQLCLIKGTKPRKMQRDAEGLKEGEESWRGEVRVWRKRGRKVKAKRGDKVSKLTSQTLRAWKKDGRFKKRCGVTVKVHPSVCTTLKTPQHGRSKTSPSASQHISRRDTFLCTKMGKVGSLYQLLNPASNLPKTCFTFSAPSYNPMGMIG